MGDGRCQASTEEGSFEQVRRPYTELALQPQNDFGWAKGRANAQHLDYDPAWLARRPDCVGESAAAAGNPFALGLLHPAETVVDVGCGAGADLCVAAILVGVAGHGGQGPGQRATAQGLKT